MPAASPEARFLDFGCTGVLNEWNDPAAGGGSSLSDCMNLIYHRNGAWGRRPGAQDYQLQMGQNPGTPVSGFRWYRAFPSPLTKLVTYTQGTLWIGNDQLSLTAIGNPSLSGATAPCFTSARDPQANNGEGADVLIVTGLTLANGSFGIGAVNIKGLPGAQPPSSWIQLTAIDASSNNVTTARYNITGADNPASIANGLCQLINTTNAFLNQGASFNPFIGETYYTQPNPDQSNTGVAPVPQAIIHMGAQAGGSSGNNITYGVTWSDAGDTGSTLAVFVGIQGQGAGEFAVTANGTLNGTGTAINFVLGGNPFSGPCKYDPTVSTNIVGLTFHCQNQFAFCESWHDHVWYWGDANNPDTIFASDINQPEAFTFMIQNGGLNARAQNGAQNGGYTIGAGDGDPNVQVCVPVGNAFYVVKTDSVYMIEGYDFQVGEYSFSVTQQLSGYGTPSPYGAAEFDGQLVFWSGKKFLRLAVGSYEPEHIGLPIPITEGLCSQAFQPNVRIITGDMVAKTLLNNVFANGSSAQTPANVIYRNLVIFSFDLTGGGDYLQVVYDDEKSAAVGGYAWTKWSGWNVGAFIRYGTGPGPNGKNTDNPIMAFIGPNGNQFFIAGLNAQNDFGSNPIAWMAQSGWIDGGTPELMKNCRVIYGNANATASAQLSATIIPGQWIPPGPPPQGGSEFGTEPQVVTFQPTLAPANCEALNNLKQYVNTGQQAGQLPIQAKAFMVQWNEPGLANAGFELRKYGIDVEEEALAT